MLDLTSSLYLGWTHPSRALRAWESLSTGVPAALREDPACAPLAARLAELVGCHRATLLPSTLHLFVDLFMSLVRPDTPIYVDAGAYPVATWGIALAGATAVRVVRHYD